MRRKHGESVGFRGTIRGFFWDKNPFRRALVFLQNHNVHKMGNFGKEKLWKKRLEKRKTRTFQYKQNALFVIHDINTKK